MLHLLTQTLLIDYKGYVLESDDVLFTRSDIVDNQLFPYMPLLESVKDALEDTQKTYYFPSVEIQNELLEGVYDFYIETIQKRNQKQIRLRIEDLTSAYTVKRARQQAYQEEIISRQTNF